MDETSEAAAVVTPQQFKALGHPARHRLLFALARGEATISQLAAILDSNKGNVAHHLKVLVDAGFVRPTGTRQVRGGTEQYYQRAHQTLSFHQAAATQAVFSAIAEEIEAAEPDPLLILRSLRLNPRHAERIAAILHDLAAQEDDDDGDARYSVLLGFWQPGTP